ncbi:MAG: putative bifunctional diguanylate cyclase/phosphodiesterase [Janthinobacterium lividum]
MGGDRVDQQGVQEAQSEGPKHIQALLEGIPHLVWQSWDDGHWYASSPQWTAFTGKPEATTLERGWLHSIHPEDRAITLQAWHTAIACGVFTIDHRIRRRDGAYRWFQTSALPIGRVVAAIEPRQWVGTSTDVNDLHDAQDRIRYLAFHDILTDLGNRAMLQEKLDDMLSVEQAQTASPFNLLYLDVDEFKHVNDRFGHRVADQLLRELAQRLTSAAHQDDVIVRMSGDEFVFLQRGAAPAEGQYLANRLRAELAAPFLVDQQVVRIDVSVGIASCPRDGAHAELLLKRADLALYNAKTAGRGRSHSFEPAMEVARHERLALQTGLADALERDELAVAYQPVFDAATGALHGYEALVRWTHPERGAIPPDVFIPIAEESGLVVPLGAWVLERACLDAARSAFGGLLVAVNFSPVQFRTGDLAQLVIKTLTRTGLPSDRLVLEITERLLMDSSEEVDQTLRVLKAAGVKIALDDFGTGYSNFGYLCRFPFDQLKIDRSFVALIEKDEGGRAVVSGITALAHSLGISVIAEGVETEIQRQMLQEIGCNQLQGYLLGRPLPLPVIEADITTRGFAGPRR